MLGLIVGLGLFWLVHLDMQDNYNGSRADSFIAIMFCVAVGIGVEVWRQWWLHKND